MARKARPWRCKPGCLSMNPVGTRKCQACGRKRPQRRHHQHKFPTQPYEVFVAIEGGSENCFICGKPPGTKKNHRDHDHATGIPRGILCFKHNALLRRALTLDVARRYVLYLERAEKIAASYAGDSSSGPTDESPSYTNQPVETRGSDSETN